MFVLALIVTLAAIFAIQSIVGVSASVANAGLVKSLLNEGEWWRLGSATFLHLNVVHLLANVSALFVFGRTVEERAGWSGLAVVYVVSGVAGSVASAWLLPETTVGASGAVLGVMAWWCVVTYRSARGLDMTAPSPARHRAMTAIGGLSVAAILACTAWTSMRLLALARPVDGPLVPQVADHQPVSDVTVTLRVWPGLEGVEYTVTNVGSNGITAWEVGFYADDGERRVASIVGDTCRPTPGRPGWLAPGQTFTQGFRSISTTSRHELTARIDVALRDGGGFEGSPARYAAILEGRRHVANELTAMGQALADAAPRTAAEALTFLTAAIDDRARVAEQSRQPLHITELLMGRRLAEQGHPRLQSELRRLSEQVRKDVRSLQACDVRPDA